MLSGDCCLTANLLTEHDHETNDNENDDEKVIGDVAEFFPEIKDWVKRSKAKPLGVGGLNSSSFHNIGYVALSLRRWIGVHADDGSC